MSERVTELRMCDTERLHLKPDTLYRFSVDPKCERCCTLALAAATDPPPIALSMGDNR